MSNIGRYKYCFVPCCTNTTVSTPEKLFISVPPEPRRTQWMTLCRRDLKKESLSAKSKFYVCGDHFDIENDVENLMYVKLFRDRRVVIRLKPGVVPSRFDCQTSRLLTHKKRKHSVLEKLEQSHLLAELNLNSTDSPSTSLDVAGAGSTTSDTICDPFGKDFGVQVTPVCCDVGVQARAYFRSTGVQASPKTKSTMSSPFKHELPSKCANLHVDIEESKEEESSVEDTDSDVVVTSSGTFSTATTSSGVTEAEIIAHKESSFKLTAIHIERRPKLYLGLLPECYFLLGMLQEATSCSTRDIMLTLKKLKCNPQFSILADDFGMSDTNASKVFKKTLPKLAAELKKLIYWPDKDRVHLKLPIQFRKNFHKVIAIIDCLEIQIERPSNPYKQAMTWSKYYGCNTFKYLLSCTPNGFINFISDGYGGRISDVELVTQCGFINYVSAGDQIMADRGFKNISSILNDVNVTLVRPPSLSSGEKFTAQEATSGRKIASLRVHVERVIGRVREFRFLLPHFGVDSSMVPNLDLAVTCVAGIINTQSIML